MPAVARSASQRALAAKRTAVCEHIPEQTAVAIGLRAKGHLRSLMPAQFVSLRTNLYEQILRK
jgi:hypothetical protein